MILLVRIIVIYNQNLDHPICLKDLQLDILHNFHQTYLNLISKEQKWKSKLWIQWIDQN